MYVCMYVCCMYVCVYIIFIGPNLSSHKRDDKFSFLFKKKQILFHTKTKQKLKT